MSEAIKSIVDTYVRLRDRETLEEMRAHRRRLRDDLQKRTDGAFDVSPWLHVMDGDLSEIDAGLARLNQSVELTHRLPGPTFGEADV